MQCLVLQTKGYEAMLELVSYYKENATILRQTFLDMGFKVYGGQNAPYVWVGFPGKPSWDVFADILHKCNIVTTPGSGFGPAGEGFVRASAFGHRWALVVAQASVTRHDGHKAARAVIVLKVYKAMTAFVAVVAERLIFAAQLCGLKGLAVSQ